MIIFALFLIGATTAILNAVCGTSNGVAVIGLLLMLPAIWRGIFHELYVYIPRRKARR